MSPDTSIHMPLILAQNEAPPALPGAPAPTGTPAIPPGPPGQTVTGASSAPPAGAARPADPGLFNPMNVLFIFLFIYLAYVFWDNSKKSKKRDQVVAAMKKGDKIYTNGGIIGVIHDVDEPEVVIKLEDNQKMRILRSSIAGPYEPASKPEEKPAS